jgi:hypothetical protein
MCKIFCVTRHDPAERDNIIQKIWQVMATTEKHGFGAAWFAPDGRICHYKARSPVLPTFVVPSFVKGAGFNEMHPKDENGNIPVSDGGFLIIHGRHATCDINLSNTHPMLGENAAMVHNGVVDSIRYENVNSTCDSEKLLRAYLDEGIEGVEQNITGYYAFMLIENVAGPNARRLHVGKDSRATLYCGAKSDAYIFSTSELLIEKYKGVVLGEVMDNKLAVFTSPTEFTETNFVPKKLDYHAQMSDWEDKVNASMGQRGGYQCARPSEDKSKTYPSQSAYTPPLLQGPKKGPPGTEGPEEPDFAEMEGQFNEETQARIDEIERQYQMGD